MHPTLNIAIRAARSAGNIIIRALDRLDTINVTRKEGYDFVTEIDQQAEQAIIKVLRKAFPNHGILAEESGHSQGDDYLWIIDPLDGTTNFIHGFPHFAVSIALQHKGKLQHGVIYDPVRQELFTSSRGKGAHLNDRRLRVSKSKTIEGALLGTGFPSRSFEVLESYIKIFQTLLPITGGIRRAGSAALDLAYVAAGRIDGFWEFGLNSWDIAAGVLMIKEAGGLVSDFQGADDYLTNGNVIAGNPKILKALLQVVNPIISNGVKG